jgi:hypothetical protein
VSTLQLDPSLLSSINNRGGRRAGDGRQHLPLSRSPIGSLVNRPSDVPGEVACGFAANVIFVRRIFQKNLLITFLNAAASVGGSEGPVLGALVAPSLLIGTEKLSGRSR